MEPSRNMTGPDQWMGSHRHGNGSHRHRVGPQHEAAVRAFVALNLAGGIGLVLILITAALSRKVKRAPTWYSFCFSWVFYAVSYSLLFLGGEQTNPNPPFSLCSAQAALIYALPPTTSCTTLALLLHVMLEIPDIYGSFRNAVISLLLLLGPYIIFLVIFVGQMAYQSANELQLDIVQKVTRGTYCESSNTSWPILSYTVVGVVSTCTIIVQGRILFQLNSKIPTLSLRDLINHNSGPVANAIRVTIFTLIGIINLTMAVMVVAFTTNMRTLTVDLIFAVFPLLTFLVFGIQKDLIESWAFWRTPTPNTDAGGIASPDIEVSSHTYYKG